MLDRLTVVGVATATFLATSLDNFALLLGFFADRRRSRVRVGLGFLAATAVVMALAHGAATVAELGPPRLLGYLGLLPLGLGLWGLFRLRRAPAPDEDVGAARGGFLAVLGVMLASSGDTLGVFASLLADTAEGLEAWIIATALALAAAYSGVASWLVAREGVASRVQGVARIVLPFLLIAVGLYILGDTRTDAVP